MKTYGERLKDAREKAEMSQSALARELTRVTGKEVKAQVIQYLEDPANKSQHSKYTARIATIIGVSPIWLESGEGNRSAKTPTMQQTTATYQVDPAALAKSLEELRPEVLAAFQTIVSAMRPAAGRPFAIGSTAAAKTSSRAGQSEQKRKFRAG